MSLAQNACNSGPDPVNAAPSPGVKWPFSRNCPDFGSAWDGAMLLAGLDQLPGFALSWAVEARGASKLPVVFARSFGDAIEAGRTGDCVVLLAARPSAPAQLGAFPVAEQDCESAVVDRMGRMRFMRDRWAHRAAHFIARKTVAGILGLPPATLALQTEEGGKPYLVRTDRRRQPLHFNVSHSRTTIAIAVAPRPVGLDIEAVRPIPDMRALLCQFAGPRTLATYDSLPDGIAKACHFYRFWTLAEAFVKATGVGLGAGSQRFDFTETGEPRIMGGGRDAEEWYFGNPVGAEAIWADDADPEIP